MNAPENKPAGAALIGRILLAEDDEPLARAYARALRSCGHEVVLAPDGVAAAECIKNQTFDVIISDIVMPRMNGVQLLRLVRESDLDVPVVLMTGSPTIDTATLAVEHGAFRYLTKPFDLDELLRTVEKALGLHKIARLKRQALELNAHDERIFGDLAGLQVGLQRALRGMWMEYQPIVSWSGQRVFAYEALLRTDDKRLNNPEAVLAAAERLGMVHAVGRQVRAHVWRMLERHPQAQFFVNLHVEDLLDPELYAANEHASRLVLEITERAALDKVPNARAAAARLRALGYRIAMDDFGAGYAGLNSFAQLEPDIAKLDMALTRNIHLEPTRRALVRSMVSACHELGVALVAEGVETIEERDALIAAGCDLLQGFLFARSQRELLEPIW
jgi:EAL domain-containing protein (putative c-di-GMP-specific phosphodiesterase class I)